MNTFKVIIIFLIILLICSCASIPDINRTYTSTDGPWVTIDSDPSTSLTISWLTGLKKPTIICWGTSPDNLREIKTDDNRPPGHLHNVRFTGLQPDTTYYYSIDAPFPRTTRKEVYSVKTASAGNEDFRFSIIGDLQPMNRVTMKTNQIISESIQRESPDFVVQLGDISMNGGINYFWKRTLRNLVRYASEIPFMAVAGNHDYHWNGNYNFRKLFPYNYESPSGLYYSQDYKNSHLIFLDGFDDDMDMSEGQKYWVEKDLEQAKKDEKQWIFIFLHKTILTTTAASIYRDIQEWLIPVADKYEVDAVFFGHAHNYEHWIYSYGNEGLLFNHKDLPSGYPIHYFSSGGGGAKMGSHFRLLIKKDKRLEYTWYDINSDSYIDREVIKKKWDSEIYIDHSDNPYYGAPRRGLHYYQLPPEVSFFSDNDLYGYQYGEQTLHYINIGISGENNEQCTISVHYPNGDLLSGPDGDLPQRWEIKK